MDIDGEHLLFVSRTRYKLSAQPSSITKEELTKEELLPLFKLESNRDDFLTNVQSIQPPQRVFVYDFVYKMQVIPVVWIIFIQTHPK